VGEWEMKIMRAGLMCGRMGDENFILFVCKLVIENMFLTGADEQLHNRCLQLMIV